MSSFRVKKPEFKCRTQFCGKEVSFAEDATKVSCDKCKRGYTIQKEEGGFAVYYESKPSKNKISSKVYKILKDTITLIVLSIIVVGLGSILYWVSDLLLRLFIAWLGKESIFDIKNFFIVGIIFGIVFASIKFLFPFWSQFCTKIIKIKKLDNPYIYSSVVLSILIIFLGGNLFNLFLGSYFPISTTPKPDNLVNITVECRSDGNMMLDPVYGNNFLCSIAIENKNNMSFKSLSFSDYDYSTGNSTPRIILDRYGANNLLENPNMYIFKISVGNEGPHRLWIEANYANESQDFYSAGGIEYVSLTREQYEDKQYKRLAFIVGLLSIAIISVFSVMNNIKSIIEK